MRLGACFVTVSLLHVACVSNDAEEGDESEQGANAGDEPDATDDSETAGSDDGSTEVGEPTSEPAGNTLPVDPSAPLVGRFLLTLQAPKADKDPLTTFTGNVGDAPYPELTVWDLVDEDEATGCRLLTPRVPDCPAGCGSDACVEDNTCVAYPVRHSVGDVTIDGVKTTDGAEAIQITPQKPRLDYIKKATVTIAYPPADEGAPLTLTSTGGDYSPLQIEVSSIAPLELAGEGALELSPDAPLALSWTPPAAGESQIEVKIDISHHGGAKGKVECLADDDGSLDVPARMTKALIELGVAGYPTVEVTRVSRGVGNVEDGRVEFQIISMRDRELKIPGLTSCMSDDDCPAPQVCKVTRSCGE